ncbi:hypothetical protein MVI27_01975 [Chryseobacterium salipaludis]|uniref:hypothetical protein n=1 Tax=Chryseobacterium TaxID=59732 RepID=UPI001FF5A143|nr:MULTISPECIES: hypothetical protein [Chryseobacterium]MCJ8497023.1 hypothetical protein [Chryseobacterium salipaludis]MCX3296504.1 hypothetical protein [Planobacterium sp. JC490]
MKLIHFDHLILKKQIPYFILLIVGLLPLLLQMFELIQFESKTVNKLTFVLPFLIITFIQSKIFSYKNIVQWNNKGASIKINSFFGTSVKFSAVHSFQYNNEKLILKMLYTKNKIIDLENIREADIDKLYTILRQYLREESII